MIKDSSSIKMATSAAAGKRGPSVLVSFPITKAVGNVSLKKPLLMHPGHRLSRKTSYNSHWFSKAKCQRSRRHPKSSANTFHFCRQCPAICLRNPIWPSPWPARTQTSTSSSPTPRRNPRIWSKNSPTESTRTKYKSQ